VTLTQKVMDARRKLAMRHPNSSRSAEYIITEALKYKVYVAWSGGRCSTVALHLTLQQDPDIPVVFNMVGFISGIRVEESRPRALGIYQKGPYYKAKRDGLWKFHPVALWGMAKLMDYVNLHNIELNPLYEMGLPRVGCMPCTGFTQWREQLSTTKPRYYKWLNREYQKWAGEPTLWEYENPLGCRQEDYE